VKIEYDPEADALYIQVREARADDNGFLIGVRL
jgi:uncharacterized protein YuzE